MMEVVPAGIVTVVDVCRAYRFILGSVYVLSIISCWQPVRGIVNDDGAMMVARLLVPAIAPSPNDDNDMY